jgi:retron-type reverse transcriptase
LVEYFNWNQIQRALFALGYVQVATRTNKLYYAHETRKVVIFMKSNKIHEEYVVSLCEWIGVGYYYFRTLWRSPTRKKGRIKKKGKVLV